MKMKDRWKFYLVITLMLSTLMTFAQQTVISGKVTEKNGNALPGVTVLIPGTSAGSVTGINGEFRLEVPANTSTLQFSFVGMKTQEISIVGRTILNVVMEEESIGLEEVVAIGYGTMKKSDLTGSVASVRSEDFVKGVTTNALQLLQGKASGVNVHQSNSEPGGAVTIRVRGAGSINSSNSVLVVIDGLPGGDPSSVNPDDIESMEILKDASAAAIYGTRAANGVVLITTKKGKTGAPVISFNTYLGYQTPTYQFDVLNATQYLQMINDISADGGKPEPYTDAEIAAAGEGTNWQDQILRNAWVNNQQLSINGGSENSKYYVSLGYLDQDGIIISSGIKKYSTLVNLELNPRNKFKFGFNLNASYDEKDIVPNTSDSPNENADPLNTSIQFDPRLTTELTEEGEYQRNPTIALDNPLALAYGYDNSSRNTRISGSTFGEYEIIDGLKVVAKLGANMNNYRYDRYESQITERGASSNGIGQITSNINNYWLFETLINYDKIFGKHHVSAVGGATWEEFENLAQFSGASQFLSDVTSTNLLQSGAVETMRVSSSKSKHTLQSLIARANYVYNDKYLLTATIRRDGTSRFSETNKFAYFPSVALGWRISQEGFMQNSSVISNLKLRAGYGQLGNEGIGNFETIQTFVAGGNTVLGDAVQSGAQPARIPNPDLVWETTEEFNIGIDFGLFENRISGDIEYYIKNTNDQLFNKPVPMSTGFSTVRTNFGSVKNSGFDIALNTVNLQGEFKWNTNITLSTLKNEVTELPPFVGDIITSGGIGFAGQYSVVQVGSPMRAYYGYHLLGMFQEGDDIANSPQPSALPGWPKFEDVNSDGKIDGNDRIVLGDPFPDLSYSMNNSFSYKNFTLDVYIMGVKGIETMNVNLLESFRPINFDRNILTDHYVNRWTPDNPDAPYPSAVNPSIYFAGDKFINNLTVVDASFFRVKTITLGYDIPVQNIKLFKSFHVYLSGENLLTITDFEGFDPDANQSGTGIAKSSYNNYPLAKVFRLGANIKF
ncbi:TonB-dependent receptor [Draconibacterium sp.]|nr:TonB-dependent receptor [Draconibacterium sp.]